MKREIPILVLVFVLPLVLRVSIGEYLLFKGMLPNVLLVSVIAASMMIPEGWLPYVYGLWCGIIEDMLYSKQIGFSILFFLGIATSVSVSRKKLMKNNILFKIFGKIHPIEWNGLLDGQPRRVLDISKAKESFGFTASVSLEDGLKQTVDWYIDQKYSYSSR